MYLNVYGDISLLAHRPGIRRTRLSNAKIIHIFYYIEGETSQNGTYLFRQYKSTN